MIEVPSAVMMAAELAREVDFFSIGSNDLTQYCLAVDRMHPLLSRQADGLHPAVLRMIDRWTDWFVLSGSVPAGVPTGLYADLVAHLKRQGKAVVLDASGEPFAAAVGRGPDIIKPNIDELSELVGRSLASQADVLAAARTLIEQGVGLVAVSMGAAGALFVEGTAAVFAVPPAITVKSTVGAGDAMVAGIVTGTLRGLDLADRARLATAFSLGTLGEVGPHLPGPEVIDAYAARVQIQTLSQD